MTDEVILKIRGKKYSGWKQAVIEKSLYQITGTFGLAGIDIYPGDPETWGIAMGDFCTVEINGQTLITGHIEKIPISYDAISHDIQVIGRDLTGDLVDCSFILSANKWENQTVWHILKALCNPYGIEVVADDSVTTEVESTFRGEFGYNDGEAVAETIHRLIGHYAFLAVSYGDGKLTLTRTSTNKTHDALELGKNVLSGSIDQSIMERFSNYIAKGSGASDETFWGPATVDPHGEFVDEVIQDLRYRPLIIQMDGKADEGKCIKRARWEARNRAGNSCSLEYEIQGWTQSNGDVWPLNALVPVVDKFLGIEKSTLLIANLVFSIDEDLGTITRMSLVDPEAFKLLPTPIKTIKTKYFWE